MLHWLQQHYLRPMSMAVEEPELPYLWQLPCIWEPVWEQKAHRMKNEDIYQLHNSLWHIDTHQGKQSLGFWILGLNIEQFFVLCFFCTAYCEVQNVIQKSKPTEPGAIAEFHNPEYEHSGMLPGLSKQLSRLTIPGVLKAAPQSMEMRTLCEAAFVLIRITETLLCFLHLISTFHGYVCSRWRVFLGLRSPQCFLFLGVVLQGYLPGHRGGRFLKVLLKNLFFAGDCVQPQETNSGEGWEKQQILKAVSHASLLFSESLVVHPACSLWGRSHGGEDREGIFQFPEETTSPCPSPSWNGTPQENPKGCTVPEDVLAVKHKALHNSAGMH